MRITLGVVFLMMGVLLISAGLYIKQQSLELADIVAMLLLWAIWFSTLIFHKAIFRKDRILPVVLPVLALGFIWLLLNLGRILSFGISNFNLYAILLGWAFFNAGLYYDTSEVLKASKGVMSC